MKVIASRKYYKQFNEPVFEIMGIAYDETKRWERALKRGTKNRIPRSLLVEQKIIEQDAFRICEKYDLLSPVYSVDGIYRGGCWFCPKQCLADLHSLWRQYPELWDKIVAMEPYSFNTFKPRGVTLKSLAERFENGYVPKRKARSNVVQLDMFGQI